MLSQPLLPLETLRRQYFSLYPVYLLQPPPPGIIATDEGQHFLLTKLLGYSKGPEGRAEVERFVRLYQPEEGYRRTFWRKVLGWMEDDIRGIDGDVEIDERFYEVLAGLMVSTSCSSALEIEAGPSSAPKTSYRTFIYDSPQNYLFEGMNIASASSSSSTLYRNTTSATAERRITLLEEQIAIQGGTTGLRTWTAALHLAHHILQNCDKLFLDSTALERGVVELGAGTGFLSILLGQMELDVIATDLGADSESTVNDENDTENQALGLVHTPLARLRANIALNGCARNPMARSLDWTDALLDDDLRPTIWDELERDRRIIIAADVIYDPELVPPLVDSIDVLIGPEGHCCALVSATVRNEDTFNIFLNTCTQHHLAIQQLNLPGMDPTSPTFWDSALDAGTEVRIMRLTRLSRL